MQMKLIQNSPNKNTNEINSNSPTKIQIKLIQIPQEAKVLKVLQRTVPGILEESRGMASGQTTEWSPNRSAAKLLRRFGLTLLLPVHLNGRGPAAAEGT